MDLLETAYQKLDEVSAHLYQKTVPVRTAAVQPQLHIHFLTATRDIFKKGISIRFIAGPIIPLGKHATQTFADLTKWIRPL